MNIGETEDEGGQCEAAQTKWRRIGELAKQPFVWFRIEIDGRCRENSRLVRLAVFATDIAHLLRLDVTVTGVVDGGHCEFRCTKVLGLL